MTGFAPAILPAAGARFAIPVPVLIIGAGAAGLTAALAARNAGADVLVLERDATPQGSTALSSGFVPAAGTRFQKAKGIADSADSFARDIQAKAKGLAEPALAVALAGGSAAAIEWLADAHAIPFDLIDGFLYPGHSVLRMHGTPRRTGAELMACLTEAATRAGADIATDAHVHALYADGGRIIGVGLDRPDGTVEAIGCEALILACSGFGGNATLVRRHLPEMADALFFGHAGNQGEALAWGAALGAATRDLGAYQGHGSLATPHNILVTWALMMEGGFQVNAAGARFSNEHQGYSEQAVAVLAQPGRVAWNIYDERRHRLGLDFADYRDAMAAGAVVSAPDVAVLAIALGLPAGGLAGSLALTRDLAMGRLSDPFGRDFTRKPPLEAPYYGVKVTGALFHTQGGLLVGGQARVLRADGQAMANLFAAGGAACGVSGPAVWGYLSGNGLLAAIGLGRIAGEEAAAALTRR
ncbi:MAG: FAD-dependent oxidoreductase [Rhodospirillales bacterium]|nr:FAD-dependent oxidoreductase [Rhodospirillales bacterium]